MLAGAVAAAGAVPEIFVIILMRFAFSIVRRVLVSVKALICAVRSALVAINVSTWPLSLLVIATRLYIAAFNSFSL